MAWCLVPSAVEKFKKGLRDGEIDPARLAAMSSLERRLFFEGLVGKENAQQVNSLFESKLLLKNQLAGVKSWVKKVVGASPQVKQDLISKIERMDKVLDPKEGEQFLEDLAKTKLKIGVTQEEAKKISDLSNTMVDARSKASKEGVFPSETDRFEYGKAAVNLENYVNELKSGSKKSSLIEKAGAFKSIQSSLDNSFFGRQGIKILYNNPGIWTKNFIKSWGDISKELVGKDAMDIIKADIYSRPNALNGKYKAGRYGLDVLSEEAFPSSLPSKIPVLGRLVKASESAYNGAALRIRADLADKYIKMAEKDGVNMSLKENAEPVGRIVGSLTGRGSLGKAESLAKEANIVFYSVKFLKSNVDTLLAPAKHIYKKVTRGYETKGEEFAGKTAAKATLKIVGVIASILATAKLLDPESVDEDPRSTNFGKLKIFGQWVDITGGMGSLVRIAARLVPTKHNGVWSNWRKSGTGTWTNLREKGFNKDTALDELENFTEGKLSPIAGLLRDYWKREFFGGEPFTWLGAAKQLVTPLPVQNAIQLLQDPKSEFVLGSIILEGLGLSTSTYNYKTYWENSTSKEMTQFREKVGETKFQEANDTYNEAYSIWYGNVSQQPEFKKLSEDGRSALITKEKEVIKEQIFKNYEFKYKKETSTPEKKQEDKTIKSLISK